MMEEESGGLFKRRLRQTFMLPSATQQQVLEQMKPGSRRADHKDKHVAARDTGISENSVHHNSDPALGGQGIGPLGYIQNSEGTTLSNLI